MAIVFSNIADSGIALYSIHRIHFDIFYSYSVKNMLRFLIVFITLLTAGCHSTVYDADSKVELVKVRVRRIAPETNIVVLGHHDESPYIDAELLVLEPQKYAGRRFKLQLIPESCGSFFANQQFWIRIPENLTLGRNRERKNKNGSTTVFGDTMAHWSFTELFIGEDKD